MYKKLAIVGATAAILTACTLNLKADLAYKSDNPEPDKAHADNASAAADGAEGKDVGDAKEHTAVSADEGGDATLYVVNLSSSNVCWVYADPCGDDTTDLLGDDALPADWYVSIDGLDEGCHDLWAFPCSDDGTFWYGRYDLPSEFTWILADGDGVDIDTGMSADDDTDFPEDTDVPEDSADSADTADTADTGDSSL